MSGGARLEEAFKSPSPYSQIQVHSHSTWDKGRLMQAGWILYDPKSNEEVALCRKIKGVVDGVNQFLFITFQSVGVDKQGTVPPFFVHMVDDNAYYHPKISNHPECFIFNDDYVQFPEVICHEYTHAVVRHMNPRVGNTGEGGAINEAIADVVGIVFKHNGYTSPNSKGSWSVGNSRDLSAGFRIENFNLDTIPRIGSDGKTTNDNGHVHHNSRLFSHAFFLASNYFKHDPVSEKQLLKLWWKTVEALDDITAEGFVKKTMEVANTWDFGLFCSAAIKSAWQGVGFQKLMENYE